MHSLTSSDCLPQNWRTRFADRSALVVMGIGALVMLGWALDSELIKRLSLSFQSMKFNTAFGLVLAGSALKWRDQAVARIALGAMVMLLGLLTLSEYIFGVDYGIDQLVFRDLDPNTEFSGRMSLIAAVCFCANGFALILLNNPRALCRYYCELAAISVSVTAMFALVGYASSVRQLYHVPGFSSIALHTSAAFLVLGLGVLSVIPNSVVELFAISGQSHSRIWGNFIVLLVILFGLGMLSMLSLDNLTTAFVNEANQTHFVIVHRITPLALLIMAMIMVIMICIKILRIILANETVIQAEKDGLRAKTEELAQSNLKIQAQHTELDWLYQNTPLGLCLLDMDLRFLRINKVLADLNGLPVEAHLGCKVSEIVPSLAAKAMEMTERIKLTGQSVLNLEFSGEAAAAPGLNRFWNESWFPVFDNSKEIMGFGIVVEEITEQKIAENALKTSEERLRLAQMSANVGVWDWDLRTGKLSWTPELEVLYGLEPGQVSCYEDFSSRVHPEDLKIIEFLCDEAINNHQQFELEFRIIRPSGETLWINSRGGAFYDESGNPVRVLGNNIDITERKQAEQALFESREYARKQAEEAQAIVNVAPVAIWIAHDPECRVITGNIYGNEIVLRTPTSQNISKSAPPGALTTPYRVYRKGIEVIANDLPAQRACATGKPVSPEELQLVFEDGRSVTLLIGATPLFDAQGNVRGAVAAGLDISERKALEYQIKEFNQRKDQFLATLSRELRNPLSLISSSLQLLTEKPLVEINRDFVCDVLNKNIDQLNQLAEDLLDVALFSSGTLTLQKQRVDLVNMLQQSLHKIRPLANRKKQVLIPDIPEIPVIIEGDPVRLTQIFNNILDNAVKYTGVGGKISLKLMLDKGWVIIRIEDNGVGIAPQLLPYIFEFFTQFNLFHSLNEKSLGIGLYLAKQLAELHGGKIKAFSGGKNQGSVFDIWLPKLAQESATLSTAPT